MKNITRLILIFLLNLTVSNAQNIITNGTFDSLGVWETEQYGGGEFTYDVVDGAAEIVIEILAENAWDLQLKQIIALEAGWTYDVSFDIAGSNDASIDIWVQENHADYATLDGQTFDVTTAWETITYTTVEMEADDDNAKLTFVFGNVGLGDEVYIDNVSMYYSGTNAVDENSIIQPQSFSISQNYPNPFNPTTKINYAIPKQSHVSLKIYDVLGNEVGVLVNEEKSVGSYSVEFDGNNLSSGLYFYKMQTSGFVETKKMMLLK